MKLKNKQTGEIVDTLCSDDITKGISFGVDHHDGNPTMAYYNSLAELNAEWEDIPEEEWRDILGFEELYQVSNFGNVRTVKNGEAEMSQQENRNGYMTVHLRNKGVERRAMVHRLVAEAFIPNPDGLRDVNHKNGNKSDNRVENLEWVSHSDNMTHSFRELGKNVRHIVQLDLDNNFIERWNSIIEASEATGICRTDIGECCRGNRKHTKGYKWKYEEDYEEPKKYWFIDAFGNIVQNEITKHCGDEYTDMSNEYENQKSIGNYFETRKEAEVAVRKLKAWKRLKDKGFEFVGCFKDNTINFEFVAHPLSYDEAEEAEQDLAFIFGGEE